MSRTVTNSFGDEILASEFDDHQPSAYRSLLLRHPLCADPDHPGCDKCWADGDATDFVETEQFNDEPVPYTSNKEA